MKTKQKTCEKCGEKLTGFPRYCNDCESDFQRQCGDFVGREVRACMTAEVYFILRGSEEVEDSPYSWEDVENFYHSFESAKEGGMIDEDTPESEYDPIMQEIFEWWAVSEYLYRQLRDRGEPVLEGACSYYWGRTTSGQAILLDSVIREIVRGE